jgi:Protein of unknown function DUF262/Protein of unknown function (DUF1524)
MFSGLPTASLTVTDLFSSPFHFSVPCYQRPYSWTKAEAGQLLEDVLGAAGIGAVEESDYFLGSILLLDGSGGDLPKARERDPRLFEIVDGQQRLVTLAILAAVLRDLGSEKWRWGARSRLDQLITADAAAMRSKGIRFRIELQAREQAFLESNVQPRGSCTGKAELDEPSEAEERLVAVRDLFVSELSALDEADRRQLADYLCDRCHVVVVLTRDIDRAHRLFTVLNQRGRSLKRNDILKAELLKSVPVENREAALARWEHASQLLGPNFEEFFSHVFSIYGRGETKIIAGVRRAIAEVGGSEPFLDQVMTPLSQAYHQVRRAADAETSIDAPARRHLVYLGRLAEGDWAPAAMLTLQQYADDPERGTLLLKEIDRFAHLLRLLCMGTGKRVRRFAGVIELIRSGAPVRPGEGPFQLSREELRNINYHLRSLYRRDQQVCKLLLLRLSDEISRSTTLLDPRDYSVEHVLPQRPGSVSEWRRWFVDAEEREVCTESLGNLVVVTHKQNDRARNQDFARKQEIYRCAEDPPVLPITRDALDTDTWRAADIRAREARLFGLIRDTWSIDVGRQGARAGAQRNAGMTPLKSDVA